MLAARGPWPHSLNEVRSSLCGFVQYLVVFAYCWLYKIMLEHS